MKKEKLKKLKKNINSLKKQDDLLRSAMIELAFSMEQLSKKDLNKKSLTEKILMLNSINDDIDLYGVEFLDHAYKREMFNIAETLRLFNIPINSKALLYKNISFALSSSLEANKSFYLYSGRGRVLKFFINFNKISFDSLVAFIDIARDDLEGGLKEIGFVVKIKGEKMPLHIMMNFWEGLYSLKYVYSLSGTQEYEEEMGKLFYDEFSNKQYCSEELVFNFLSQVETLLKKDNKI